VRPAWDIILIGLMLGGIAVSATGVYLALRRVRNDIVVLYRVIARRGAAPSKGLPSYVMRATGPENG
jgi:hypothetical protein